MCCVVLSCLACLLLLIISAHLHQLPLSKLSRTPNPIAAPRRQTPLTFPPKTFICQPAPLPQALSPRPTATQHSQVRPREHMGTRIHKSENPRISRRPEEGPVLCCTASAYAHQTHAQLGTTTALKISPPSGRRIFIILCTMRRASIVLTVARLCFGVGEW
jgi:hypothetical protein